MTASQMLRVLFSKVIIFTSKIKLSTLKKIFQYLSFLLLLISQYLFLKTIISCQLLEPSATVMQISSNACILAIAKCKNTKQFELGQFGKKLLLVIALQAYF